MNYQGLIIILAAFSAGCLFTLLAVGLGGLLVFRTKREPHEALFRPGPEKGEAFVLDDFEEGFLDEKPVPGKNKKSKPEDPVPGIVAKQTEKFLAQFKASKEAGD